MPKNEYSHGLFIFRRDLRLEDNTALNAALESSAAVLTVFILDPRQADPLTNPYFSANAFAFMVESLVELDRELRRRGGGLTILHGRAHEAIAQVIDFAGIDAVFVNRDVTPFAKERDERITRICEERGCLFHASDDVMLNPPEAVLTNAKPYRVFTPYWKSCREREPSVPRTRTGTFEVLEGSGPETISVHEASPQRTITGGRSHALTILEDLDRLEAYLQNRDFPAQHATSRLSAHLKFGTISAREAVWAIRRNLGEGHALERQLYWRDFYHQLLFHYPAVLGAEFDPAYDAGIVWNEPGVSFDAWKAGRTGFPIVDAGMRELLATGWMHNRVRMITASFLTKDLLIDWRQGERHFARFLVDYDVANNNGGWQWAASTGADAAPYFRIFNPWLQQKRFDPDATYIKRWVPELRELSAEMIHMLDTKRPSELNYPEPIIDHPTARNEALRRYRHARERP